MNEREFRFDVIRLLSTILVVVIHISNYYCRYMVSVKSSAFIGAITYNAIGRVSVPLFFMISGALTLRKDIPFDKLMKKVLHFIIILSVWTLFYILFDIKFMGYTFEFADYINLLFSELKPHLWYMYAIIALYLVTPFVRILVKNMTKEQENLFLVLWGVFCGGVIVLKLVMEFFFIEPVGIENKVPLVQGTYYLGYFMAGHILYNRIKDGSLNISRHLLHWASVINIMIAILLTLYFSRREGTFYTLALAYRNLPYIIASVSLFIYIMTMPDIKSSSIKKVLNYLSPILFGVYLTHNYLV